MGGKEPWQEKFRRLLREAAQDAIDRPIKVIPKRASNPRITPPDWYLEEVNKLLPKRDEPEIPPAA